MKKVKSTATPNQVMDDKALIQKYKGEILELKNQLQETNQLLELERQHKDISLDTGGMSREERLRYEEQLHESALVRNITS